MKEIINVLFVGILAFGLSQATLPGTAEAGPTAPASGDRGSASYVDDQGNLHESVFNTDGSRTDRVRDRFGNILSENVIPGRSKDWSAHVETTNPETGNRIQAGRTSDGKTYRKVTGPDGKILSQGEMPKPLKSGDGEVSYTNPTTKVTTRSSTRNGKRYYEEKDSRGNVISNATDEEILGQIRKNNEASRQRQRKK